MNLYKRNPDFRAMQRNRFFADYFVFEMKKSPQSYGYYDDEILNLVSNTFKYESDGEHGGMYLF
jgi:hypothetical protein